MLLELIEDNHIQYILMLIEHQWHSLSQDGFKIAGKKTIKLVLQSRQIQSGHHCSVCFQFFGNFRVSF